MNRFITYSSHNNINYYVISKMHY